MPKIPFFSIEEGKRNLELLIERGKIDPYAIPILRKIAEVAVTLDSCSGQVGNMHLHEFEMGEES